MTRNVVHAVKDNRKLNSFIHYYFIEYLIAQYQDA